MWPPWRARRRRLWWTVRARAGLSRARKHDVCAGSGSERRALTLPPPGVACALSESEPTCVVETELFGELYSLTWCVQAACWEAVPVLQAV